MYLVEWADSTGVYSQRFDSYTEAINTLTDLQNNSVACSIDTLEDGSDMYWSEEERDYVGGR